MSIPADDEPEEIFFDFLSSGKYSDFTVKCEDRTWKLHRVVLCSRSTYFAKVCDSDFKEVQESTITLKEEDAQLIYEFLLFMYTGKDPSLDGGKIPVENLARSASMYGLADKYGCKLIKNSIKSPFKAAVQKHWNSDSFVAAAEIVYSTTPYIDRGLRDSIRDVTFSYQRTLLRRQDLQDVIEDNVEYACDLAQAMILAAQDNKYVHTTPIRGNCKKCGNNVEPELRCLCHGSYNSHQPQVTYPK